MMDFIQKGLTFNMLDDTTVDGCFTIDREILPIKWIDMIPYDGHSQVDIYRAKPGQGHTFPYPFVVKRVGRDNRESSRKLFMKEWEIAKNLRHPHITALLNAYEWQNNFYLSFYPFARCDLGTFMDHMKVDVNDSTVRKKLYHKMYPKCKDKFKNSIRSSESDIETWITSEQYLPNLKTPLWPLDLDLAGKKNILRRCPGCLCKALNHLHKTFGVRHKDIKPQNILIDESGSFKITDFGISKCFPPNTSHATQEQPSRTDHYASPEILNDRERDDRSDTFSLGCVILEVVSVLFDHDRESLREHFLHLHNELRTFTAYADQLPQVHSWISILRGDWDARKGHQMVTDIDGQEENHTDSSERKNSTIESLDILEAMLSEKKEDRPDLNDAWQTFRKISPDEVCEDCEWEPPPRQQEKKRRSRDKRLSIEQRSTCSTEAITQRKSSFLVGEEYGGNATGNDLSQERITAFSPESAPVSTQIQPASILLNASSASCPPQSIDPPVIAFVAPEGSPFQSKLLAPGSAGAAPSISLQDEDSPKSFNLDNNGRAPRTLASDAPIEQSFLTGEAARASQQFVPPSGDEYVLAYEMTRKRVVYHQYAAIAGKQSR